MQDFEWFAMVKRDLPEVGATKKKNTFDKMQYFVPSGLGGPHFLLYYINSHDFGGHRLRRAESTVFYRMDRLIWWPPGGPHKVFGLGSIGKLDDGPILLGGLIFGAKKNAPGAPNPKKQRPYYGPVFATTV